MMKKNKILGIAIALGGIALSFGTAFALYIRPASNVSFQITSEAHTTSSSTISYSINGSTGNNIAVTPQYYTTTGSNNGTVLGKSNGEKEYWHIKYEYTLGATYANDLVTQQNIVGDLSVSFTNIHSSLQNHSQVSMYFEGYLDNTLGKHFYGANLTSNSTSINQTRLTGSSLTVDTREMAVATSGVQKLVIYIAIDNDVDTLSMNEANNLWTLNVTWGAPASFNYAYVVSTKSLWAPEEEYVMAPDIGKGYSSENDWGWIAKIKGDAQLTKAKCYQHENSSDKWSGGSDAEIANNTYYEVKWSGGNDVAATFTTTVA